MKYINAYTKQVTDDPNSERRETKKIGAILFGDRAMVFGSVFKKEYVLYSDVAWSFIFDQEFQSKVMGRRFFRGFDYLMLISHDCETAFVPFRKNVASALENLSRILPNIDYDYSDELQEKYFGPIEQITDNV